MPGYRYLWPTLIFLSCFHFGRRDPYIEGLQKFHSGDLEEAEKSFLSALGRKDSVEQARRYLFKIYRLEGKENKAKDQYLKLLKTGIVDQHIIDYLSKFYMRKGNYHSLYLILKIGSKRITDIGEQLVDRELLAVLLTGLLTRGKHKNPINWVIEHGYLNPMPDGNFYPRDTVLIENFAVVLAPHLPSINNYYPNYSLGYPLAKISPFTSSTLVQRPQQPLKLKDAIEILDKVKNYLR